MYKKCLNSLVIRKMQIKTIRKGGGLVLGEKGEEVKQKQQQNL